MKLTKPNREVLDYTIYEIGYEKTKERYGLTDQQIEDILFDKNIPVNKEFRFKEPKMYEALTEIIQPELSRIITENYQALRKKYVNNKNKINNRSISKEDIFHDTLLNLLKGSYKYVYTTDEEALKYIGRTFKFDKIDAANDSKAEKQFKELLYHNQLTEENEKTMLDEIFNNREFIDLLSSNQQIVLQLISEGHQLVYIAELMQVTKQMISKQKNIILRKMKQYLEANRCT